MTIDPDHVPKAAWLGAIYGISEIALLFTRRSKTEQRESQDRHSLTILWIVIFVSIYAALAMSSGVPSATLPHPRALAVIGIVLFVGGITLRWRAIIVLGQFFTVDVSISREHRVVDSGPYRWIRHPSYTGVLVAFLGLGLCLDNWLSILCLMIPITLAFLWRIRVEERALLAALGDDYQRYAARTKRLVPFLL